MEKFFKYFLFIFLPSAIAFFAFITYFYLSETEQVNTLRLERERLNVYMGKRAIQQEFQLIISDLLILSKHHAFHSNQRLLTQDALKNLQNDFLVFSDSFCYIFQLPRFVWNARTVGLLEGNPPRVLRTASVIRGPHEANGSIRQ